VCARIAHKQDQTKIPLIAHLKIYILNIDSNFELKFSQFKLETLLPAHVEVVTTLCSLST
jgi:hypothetical protein